MLAEQAKGFQLLDETAAMDEDLKNEVEENLKNKRKKSCEDFSNAFRK